MVSIGLAHHGLFNVILFENLDCKITLEAGKSMYPGKSRMSAYVRLVFAFAKSAEREWPSWGAAGGDIW